LRSRVAPNLLACALENGELNDDAISLRLGRWSKADAFHHADALAVEPDLSATDDAARLCRLHVQGERLSMQGADASVREDETGDDYDADERRDSESELGPTNAVSHESYGSECPPS
jgi:hypothetical protein